MVVPKVAPMVEYLADWTAVLMVDLSVAQMEVVRAALLAGWMAVTSARLHMRESV